MNDLEDQVPTFAATIVDLKKAVEAEDLEVQALRKAFRVIEAIVELRDCSSWPSTYVTVSRQWERWTGLHEIDVIGKSDYDYRPRKMADQITLMLKEVIGSSRTLSYVAPTGNEASNFKPVRFVLTPFAVAKKNYVISIGMPSAGWRA
jgi:hypothetical protein